MVVVFAMAAAVAMLAAVSVGLPSFHFIFHYPNIIPKNPDIPTMIT